MAPCKFVPAALTSRRTSFLPITDTESPPQSGSGCSNHSSVRKREVGRGWGLLLPKRLSSAMEAESELGQARRPGGAERPSASRSPCGHWRTVRSRDRPSFRKAGRGLQGRGRGFDMGSITVPDRTLQRQKEPSVTLVFCKLRPSFSLSRHSREVLGREGKA